MIRTAGPPAGDPWSFWCGRPLRRPADRLPHRVPITRGGLLAACRPTRQAGRTRTFARMRRSPCGAWSKCGFRTRTSRRRWRSRRRPFPRKDSFQKKTGLPAPFFADLRPKGPAVGPHHCTAWDWQKRRIVDEGPAAASFRLVATPYPLDCRAAPVAVPAAACRRAGPRPVVPLARPVQQLQSSRRLGLRLGDSRRHRLALLRRRGRRTPTTVPGASPFLRRSRGPCPAKSRPSRIPTRGPARENRPGQRSLHCGRRVWREPPSFAAGERDREGRRSGDGGTRGRPRRQLGIERHAPSAFHGLERIAPPRKHAGPVPQRPRRPQPGQERSLGPRLAAMGTAVGVFCGREGGRAEGERGKDERGEEDRRQETGDRRQETRRERDRRQKREKGAEEARACCYDVLPYSALHSSPFRLPPSAFGQRQRKPSCCNV